MSPQADQTIFVVDDDAAMRDSLRWLLESAGLQVETHPNGEAFLESFEPDRSGCVLLDVRMPGMGGFAVARELQKRHIPIPVIILTAYADSQTAKQAREVGALAFLKKPFDDQVLLDAVGRALDATD